MRAALSLNLLCSVSVWQSLQDSAIAEFIAKSSKLCYFPNCLRFSKDLALRHVLWRHRNAHFSQRKVVSQFQKWNELICVLFMPDLQELHRTNEPKADRIRATRLGYTAQTIYLLGPEPRAAHVTPLYTALGNTVKKVESITSLSNLVRSIQFGTELLKLQTSEQTPLMWKPG